MEPNCPVTKFTKRLFKEKGIQICLFDNTEDSIQIQCKNDTITIGCSLGYGYVKEVSLTSKGTQYVELDLKK